jgi:acetyl esterase/lipase
LVGDSAGGNLAAALTILAIKEQIKVPDGLMMVYPALNLDVETYTPSILHSIDDACNTNFKSSTSPHVLEAMFGLVCLRFTSLT